jgi:hypothetical protein
VTLPSFPPYVVAAQEVTARAEQYRQAKDWPSLLSLRLRMAARYPRREEPLVQLLNDFLAMSWEMHNPLPRLAPLAAYTPGLSPIVRADAVVLDQLQAQLMARLEAFAARRGIPIHSRRKTRAVLIPLAYGPTIPWFGPPQRVRGVYLVSPLPRRVPVSHRGQFGRPRFRWEWPRLTIVLSEEQTHWWPLMLADLLVQLGVFIAHHRRRLAALNRATYTVPPGTEGNPWPTQRAAMLHVGQLGTPARTVNQTKASGAIKRCYSRLLIWLLRDEISKLTLAPVQQGE